MTIGVYIDIDRNDNISIDIDIVWEWLLHHVYGEGEIDGADNKEE